MLNDTIRVEKMHRDLFMKEMPKQELIKDDSKSVQTSYKDKNKLTEAEKMNKAMKEVNQQIIFNGALELLIKAFNKASEKCLVIIMEVVKRLNLYTTKIMKSIN